MEFRDRDVVVLVRGTVLEEWRRVLDSLKSMLETKAPLHEIRLRQSNGERVAFSVAWQIEALMWRQVRGARAVSTGNTPATFRCAEAARWTMGVRIRSEHLPVLSVDEFPGISASNQPLIEIPTETRVVEYKGPMSWPEAKWKIVRAALGLANVDGGGWVVVGVAEPVPGSFDAVGLSGRQARSFKPDEISRQVNEVADPAARLTTEVGRLDDRLFVVIQVAPFDQVPIVCRKGGENLKKGAIYTRATGMNESVPVPGETEMREVLERAADLQVRRTLERLERMGIAPPLGATTGVLPRTRDSARRSRLRAERGAFE